MRDFRIGQWAVLIRSLHLDRNLNPDLNPRLRPLLVILPLEDRVAFTLESKIKIKIKIKISLWLEGFAD